MIWTFEETQEQRKRNPQLLFYFIKFYINNKFHLFFFQLDIKMHLSRGRLSLREVSSAVHQSK